jgi:hypothetical protein
MRGDVMSKKVFVFVGTQKGGFIFESNGANDGKRVISNSRAGT